MLLSLTSAAWGLKDAAPVHRHTHIASERLRQMWGMPKGISSLSFPHSPSLPQHVVG